MARPAQRAIVRRRMRAHRCCPTRSRSSPRHSSTGRTRRWATIWRAAWSSEKTGLFEVVVDLVADRYGDQSVRLLPRSLRPSSGLSPTTLVSAEVEIAPFRKVTPPGTAALGLVAKVDRNKQRTIGFHRRPQRRGCNRRSATSCALKPGVQDWRGDAVLAMGSAADSGWLRFTILRHLGFFAARFVFAT